MPENFPQKLSFGTELYHPAWERINAQITRWLRVYHGGEGAKGLLVKFPKETENEYIKRKKVTAFPKLCARVLNVYNAHLFAEEPERDKLPDSLQDYVTNIDGDGTNIDTLLSQAYGDIALPAGLVYFLVTATATDDSVETRADEKASERRPLVVPYDPRELVKWDFDSKGRLKYIVLKDYRRESDDWDQKHTEYELLRIWTPTQFAVYKQAKEKLEGRPESSDYELDATGVNPVGEVPLVACYNIRKARFEGETEMGTLGLSSLNVDIYNKRSWLDQGLEFQGFPVGVLKQPNMDPKAQQYSMEWSPSSCVRLFGEKDDFKLVETTGNALGLLQGEIKDRIREFLDTGFRRITISTPSAQKEAAEAKRIEFAQFEASLKEKAVNIDEAERNIWRYMAAWDGNKLTADQLEESTRRHIDLDPEQIRPELKDLISLFTAQIISHDTVVNQAKEFDYLTESVDAEEERDKIDLELANKPPAGGIAATAQIEGGAE